MINIDIPIKKIQEIRLIHAIAESGCLVYISQNDAHKFLPLKHFFGMEFEIGECKASNFSDITKINHKEPLTAIGSLEKCLIFPHSITDHLKEIWQNKRDYRFSFTGLITSERKKTIESWLNRGKSRTNYKLPNRSSVTNRIFRKINSILNIERDPIDKIGEIYIWSSRRGRNFPIKSWDDAYFKVLANSDFVLCPSGDYVWTYRFFESILCGAIPVIENHCKAYTGFKFKYMSQEKDSLIYDRKDAEYNYNLCLERITIPKDSIALELAKY